MTKKTLTALSRAHYAALNEATDALFYGDRPAQTTRVLQQAHTVAYNNLRRVVQYSTTGRCENCGHYDFDLRAVTYAPVRDWFEANVELDLHGKYCPTCRREWYYEAGCRREWDGDDPREMWWHK